MLWAVAALFQTNPDIVKCDKMWAYGSPDQLCDIWICQCGQTNPTCDISDDHLCTMICYKKPSRHINLSAAKNPHFSGQTSKGLVLFPSAGTILGDNPHRTRWGLPGAGKKWGPRPRMQKATLQQKVWKTLGSGLGSSWLSSSWSSSPTPTPSPSPSPSSSSALLLLLLLIVVSIVTIVFIVIYSHGQIMSFQVWETVPGCKVFLCFFQDFMLWHLSWWTDRQAFIHCLPNSDTPTSKEATTHLYSDVLQAIKISLCSCTMWNLNLSMV